MWLKGVHKVVSLRDLPRRVREASVRAARRAGCARGSAHAQPHAAERLDHVKLMNPADTVEPFCDLCHEKTPGRPATQKQIGEAATRARSNASSVITRTPKLAAVRRSPGSEARRCGAAGKPQPVANCLRKPASANPVWPSLAGQQRGYLVSALQAYKAGASRDP